MYFTEPISYVVKCTVLQLFAGLAIVYQFIVRSSWMLVNVRHWEKVTFQAVNALVVLQSICLIHGSLCLDSFIAV